VKVNVPVELTVRKESGFVPHNIVAKAPAGGLRGAEYVFPKVSVGATENLLISGVAGHFFAGDGGKQFLRGNKDSTVFEAMATFTY